MAKERISDEFKTELQEGGYWSDQALARALGGMTPDISHLYKPFDEEVPPVIVDRLAMNTLRGEALTDINWDQSEAERARCVQLRSLISEQLLRALREISATSRPSPKRETVSLIDLQSVLNDFGISISEMWQKAPKFNEETKIPRGFELETPLLLAEVALGDSREEWGLPNFDSAILVPNVETSELITTHFHTGIPYRCEIRGFEGGEDSPDDFINGSPGNLNALRGKEEIMLPSVIIAATQGSVEQVQLKTDVNRPKYTVRFLDSETIGGRESEKEVLFKDAIKNNLPIMDLQTFLTLCIHPDFSEIMDPTYRVALNHMLPSGKIASAGKGREIIMLDNNHYPQLKNCRVFIAG